MVNNKNISLYTGEPPTDPGASREIQGGPLYDRQAVLGLCQDADALQLWTTQCAKDVADQLSWDVEDVAAFIPEAIINGRHHASEWCQQSPTGPWAACDAYVYSRNEFNEYAYKEMAVRYYIKFAISKTGTLLLVVSCHTQKNR